EAHAVGELAEDVLAVAGRGGTGDAQPAVEQQRDARRAGGQPEADRAAEGGDEDAGDRGADHPAGLPGNGAERDRVRQPRAVDELRDEREPARLVEGAERVDKFGQRREVAATRYAL